jgi:tetratricopeptide (TPR) repeat protein
MFNAERAYEEGTEMTQARLDSLPSDSETVASGAEIKKYDRVIEKGSRVLERFPENKRQTAMAVFLIGESFRHKGEWTKAITKYDEFERYFSDHDSMPTVEYQRAYCLYKNGEYDISRFALEPVLKKDHPYYHEGLNLLSLLEEKTDFPEQAIAALEKMLADTNGTPYIRGKAHLRLADLYFKMENWSKAREHYLAKEIQELIVRDRYSAAFHAAECEANQEHYLVAAEEYKVMADNKDYENYLADILIRRGELLLLAGNWTEGEKLLQKVVTDYPKSETCARGYYDLGDFAQTEQCLYEKALMLYDSSFIAKPASSWGRNSRERRDALKRLMMLQQAGMKAPDTTVNGKKKFFDTQFQIAELFLFKLSEMDSSLKRLDAIIEASPDTNIVLRATYARAFIYDEFKNDPDKAAAFYREIIAKYPNTEYAKQSQINLGQRITVKTREDLAHDRFLKAESLWVVAQAIPLEQMGTVDSSYAKAIAAYDSVFQEFPDTRSGIQALYMKATLYGLDPAGRDSALVIYKQLRSNYGNTPWGQAAELRLQTRLSITDEELSRMRKRVEQNDAYVDKLSKQYHESFQQQKDPTKPAIKSNEDEVLENSYNSMYDFQ